MTRAAPRPSSPGRDADPPEKRSLKGHSLTFWCCCCRRRHRLFVVLVLCRCRLAPPCVFAHLTTAQLSRRSQPRAR